MHQSFLGEISFTPAFSPVLGVVEVAKNGFNGFHVQAIRLVLTQVIPGAQEGKPLKRFCRRLSPAIKGLKPGVNERGGFDLKVGKVLK